VRLLRRRPVADARELAACVTACIGGLAPGLRAVERPPAVAEAPADVVAVDPAGGLVLVVCEPEASPATALRALECAAWWREHAPLVPAAAPGALEGSAPRAVVVAGRYPERTRRALRALGEAAPQALECRLYDEDGAILVAFEVVGAGAAPETNGAGHANGVAHGAHGARAGDVGATLAAAGVGERLARLRFSEAFRETRAVR
jgi:hypothetical protein